MQNLGTWTTIDCPTEQVPEALMFLREEFSKIEGEVRKVNNSHDFGVYPSFEIDMPEKFENIEDPDYDYDMTDEDEKLVKEWEDWKDKANEIEERYCEKFNDYL